MKRSVIRGQANDVADLVITGGKVATLDVEDRIVDAVAISDEHILTVGSNADMEAVCGPETHRIDAGGRLVIPGLIDGHAHMDREGLKEALPSLAGCECIDDILQRVEVLVRDTPPGEWIVTMPIGEPPFYEGVPNNLRENRFPTRRELDRVSPEHPVYIRAIWGHWRNSLPLVSIANSNALERAGIDRDTVPPAPSIQIDREVDGDDLSGIFYESTYKPLVEKTLLKCIPRFTLDDRIAGLRRSMEVYNGYGTTSVFEGHGIAGEVFAAYQALHENAPLPVRSVLMFSPAWPGVDIETVKDLLVDWGNWLAGRGLGDAHLRMCGLYTESDYSEENRLRALCGPYTGWAGFNFDAGLPEDIMVEMMVEAARAGIRVGSFSPNILELFERVDARASIAEQRWIIEHIGMFESDQIKRARDLGVVMQAYTNMWIWQQGEKLRSEHGNTGAECIVPMRDLLGAGIHVSLATDNVPPTLFVPMWHVIARQTRDGRDALAPDQCLSRAEALACASREGAWLSFEEDFKGTIEPGKAADLAILNEDLLTVDAERIPDIVADLTITAGRIVHQRPA